MRGDECARDPGPNDGDVTAHIAIEARIRANQPVVDGPKPVAGFQVHGPA